MQRPCGQEECLRPGQGTSLGTLGGQKATDTPVSRPGPDIGWACHPSAHTSPITRHPALSPGARSGLGAGWQQGYWEGTFRKVGAHGMWMRAKCAGTHKHIHRLTFRDTRTGQRSRLSLTPVCPCCPLNPPLQGHTAAARRAPFLLSLSRALQQGSCSRLIEFSAWQGWGVSRLLGRSC